MLGYIRKRLARTGGVWHKEKVILSILWREGGGFGGKECIYIFSNISSKIIKIQLCSFNFIPSLLVCNKNLVIIQQRQMKENTMSKLTGRVKWMILFTLSL